MPTINDHDAYIEAAPEQFRTMLASCVINYLMHCQMLKKSSDTICLDFKS